MSTLIVYCSNHGTTEKVANLLKEKLSDESVLLDVSKEKKEIMVADFDTIIVGGSIHIGNLQKKLKIFLHEYNHHLITKKLGFFLCCMHDGDQAIEQMNNAFPEHLREKAVAIGMFGGEFLVSKMNFLERLIVKKVAGVSENTSRINDEEINRFVEIFNCESTRT
ncbi:MAG: flavodoxin domain-containing protein [Bacillus sp. (in: Bacteria)]|nr:flavodoxin domain-containing protein [Bacillus sp. (in: firmicutes)]